MRSILPCERCLHAGVSTGGKNPRPGPARQLPGPARPDRTSKNSSPALPDWALSGLKDKNSRVLRKYLWKCNVDYNYRHKPELFRLLVVDKANSSTQKRNVFGQANYSNLLSDKYFYYAISIRQTVWLILSLCHISSVTIPKKCSLCSRSNHRRWEQIFI